MSHEQYRPPGRSNRSGRSQADNDVFEGLPVKQWGRQQARISLAPPASENADGKEDKWGEPPMPRDSHLLQPWTQQLLRLARSGKVGMKRKPDVDLMDEDRPDEEAAEEPKANLEDRGYVAKKWKPVAEAQLEPEHKHFDFLAKRRKGLPILYGPELATSAVVPMRKTKVRKAGPDSEVNVYEVLVPEGQTVEGEVHDPTELEEIKPVAAVPGTVIEGVGIANDDGVLVAEHLKPSANAPRRSRPPPKKKGGPGRGKKRVTFTNPDGSTYTAIVPNATKIVAQPGQIVKHVTKGEEAAADISVEQAAAQTDTQEPQQGEGEGEGEGDEEGSEDGEEGEDEDDDREEGELSEDDAPTAGATPAKAMTPAPVKAAEDASSKPMPAPPSKQDAARSRDASSSPELPLAKTAHSRHGSLTENLQATSQTAPQADTEMTGDEDVEKFEDGEEDLLGNLEKHLEG